MNINYATFLLGQSKKGAAIQQYEKALEIACKAGDHAMQIECNRLIGQLSDGLLGSSKTIACYEKCIEIARSMPPAKVRQSSIGYIASLLLNNYGENSTKGKSLNETMINLLGNGWKVSTKPLKQAATFD